MIQKFKFKDHEEWLREWNCEKNQGLTPDMFSRGCEDKVWWKCAKCGYEWQAKILR